MNRKKIIAMIMAMSIGIGAAGCQLATTTTSNSGAAILSSINVSSGDKESVGAANTFIESGSDIKVTGTGVTVSGSTVTINSGGTYSIKGTLSDGQIIVSVENNEKVYIILNGVNITNSQSAPIYIVNAKKAIISIADGTENHIKCTAAETAANAEPDAAIFSKVDLVFTGGGSLSVESDNNKGIVGKDDLKIENGKITITSAGDGIRGRDSVVITSGNIVIDSGADGIQANNDEDVEKGYVLIEGGKINITSIEDGIQGEVSTLIRNGDITIKTGGGSANSSKQDSWGQWGQDGNARPGDKSQTTTAAEGDTASAKALKAGVNIVIEGGNISIDSSDDALHSGNNLVISGGSFNISSGDDGIHADSTLTLNNGTVNITKSYEGIESQGITVKDGTINLVASDDGFNAAGGNDSSSTSGRQGQNNLDSSSDAVLNINGGSITVNAGGDGLDSNGTISMTAGTVYVSGPTNDGNGAIDYGSGFNITGGTLIAAGSSGMAVAPSTSSTQNSVKINLVSQSANSTVKVVASDGTEVLTYTPSKQYASVVVSSPKLKTGSTYKVYVVTGSTKTEIGSFTISGTVTELTQNGATTGRTAGGGRHTPPTQ
ncbi:MAG: carbohydrate-binding domain-containing protein [Clostridiaceae bacterium]